MYIGTSHKHSSLRLRTAFFSHEFIPIPISILDETIIVLPSIPIRPLMAPINYWYFHSRLHALLSPPYTSFLRIVILPPEYKILTLKQYRHNPYPRQPKNPNPISAALTNSRPNIADCQCTSSSNSESSCRRQTLKVI